MDAKTAELAAVPDLAAVRADFPRARAAAYLDNASAHPLSVHCAAALHRYVDWLTHEVGEPWWPEWAARRDDAKLRFARLVGADADEIAFARSTVESESNLLNGLHDHLAGGNVVTNDLHYAASLYNYQMRRQEGLDVRMVRHRGWQVTAEDMAEAVDRHTRLIAVSLVSNVNGFRMDVRALSSLAHDHGALLYADIIQAAGAVPIDVRAMGIDLAACSTFKWLMGVKGFGFLYVRKDLQGDLVKPTQHCGGIALNYAPWTAAPEPGLPEVRWAPVTGPSRYEVSYPSYEGAVCAQESLRYLEALGVQRIRAHVRELTGRLQEELPALGYPSITPRDNDSPIVAFVAADPEQTLARARQAGVHVALRFGDKLRLSPSVYNNHDDVDRLLRALR